MVQLYKRRADGEILINTETLNNQSGANIALLPGGGFVMVWVDGSMTGGDTSGFAIRGQRYDSDGFRVGSEFLVNTTVTGNQVSATVASLPSGRFVVTWTDSSATGGDTAGTAVRGRMFEANGAAVGGEFLVNTTTAGNQGPPAVAELGGGGFVITWADLSATGGDTSGSAIRAQLFDANGAKVGTEFLVNTVTDGSQTAASVIPLPGGGFAIAWTGAITPAGGLVTGSVRLQLFDAAGVKVGIEQVVNASNDGNFNSVNISALNAGFIITWAQQDAVEEDGVPVTYDLHAQMYDADGDKVGVEFIVNKTRAGTQSAADVDRLPGGGFIVTWQGPAEGTTDVNIYGQFFDDNGLRVGGEFLINTVTDGAQSGARVEVTEFGDIVVIWTDASGTGGDTSGSGIKMQIFVPTALPPTDISISNTQITEVAIENLAVATLSAASPAVNSHVSYTIISDASGAFRIEGDRLVIHNSSLLDFETRPTIEVRIRATDINGGIYEETLTIAVGDAVTETRYAAGDEFTVSGDSSESGNPIASAALTSGGFVVISTWFEIGVGDGFRFQLFDADGTRLGDETDLDLPANGLSDVAVTGLSFGGFAVAYEVAGTGQIRMQLYDAAGDKDGGAVTVSTDGTSFYDLSVATLDSGVVIVTWSSNTGEGGGSGQYESQVRARLFDADGQALGAEFRANTGVDGAQRYSQVVALADGGFVITWSEETPAGATLEGQRFDAAGNKVGPEITLAGDLDYLVASIAGLSGGGFIASWSEMVVEDDVNLVAIKAQLVDAGGNKIGGPITLANVATTYIGAIYNIAATADGGFVLSWQTLTDESENEDDLDNFARFFDSDGVPIGDAFMVSGTREGIEGYGRALALASGDIAFQWFQGHVVNGQLESYVAGRILTLSVSSLPTGPTEGPDTIDGTAGPDTIDGLGGDDVINGLAGDDILTGGHGDDVVHGGDDDDVITELSGTNDELYGDGGDDRLTYQPAPGVTTVLLDGGAGDDLIEARITFNDFATLIGGSGNDRIIFNAGDSVTVDAGEGNDLLQFDLFGQVYTLTLGAGPDIVALYGDIGSEGGLVISDFEAGDNGDAINLGLYLAALTIGGVNPFTAGYMTLTEFEGDTRLEIKTTGPLPTNPAYVIIIFEDVAMSSLTAHNLGGFDPQGAAVAALSLTGSGGVDHLTGNSNNDLIAGAGGNDVLFGAAGNDSLQGGDGDDELIGQTGNDNLEGGSGRDTLRGDTGDDFLDGGANADILRGGVGNDTYIIDHGSDEVVEGANQGTRDVIYARVSYTMAAGVQAEVLSVVSQSGGNAIDLTGNAFYQELYGNTDANFLDGGAGADSMQGFAGNDTYIVDHSGDAVIEGAGEGTRDVIYARTHYTMAAGLEVEVLSVISQAGGVAIDLTGNAFYQELYGNTDANFLDGGAGADSMQGFAGNDTYIVDHSGDAVIEGAGEGTRDVIYARTHYTMAAGLEVEVLSVISQSGGNAIDLTGNAFYQELYGNTDANFLDGGAGADYLQGFAGNDTYIVDVQADTIIEGAAEGNRDVLFARASYALGAGVGIEVMATISAGATTAIDLTGNELANEMYGNAGANVLNGLGGGDYLQGFGGADTFAFTTALGAGNVDTVADFAGGTDKLRLDDAVFTGIGTPGAFNAAAFVVGSAAADGDDRIVYNSATGQLFYDADGNGAGAALLFATLSGNPALAVSDFQVI